jgi:D,D-heptose 1,7-bisphosphate phosphatase
MKNIDLVILAGGKGSRIKEFLQNKPKPMLKFNKIYFLQYLINNLSRYPFNKIYILTGYKNKIIHNNFHNKVSNLTKIICLKEKKAMGTGGALLNLKKFKMNDFILVNGDTIFDIDIKNLINLFKKNKLGCIGLTLSNKNTDSLKLNSLGLNKNIIYYKKKGNLINGGIYFFKKNFLNKLPNKLSSLENDVLPKLIKKKLIIGKYYKNFFLDIGTRKYLKSSGKKLKKYFKRPATFLDRDGVINYDHGYVHKMKDFHFKKGVISGLKYLIKKKYFIFIITNQAGIAKGKFKENDFLNLQTDLKRKLLKTNIKFDDIQYCPYHPNGKILKYKKKSNLRKPGNKMIKNIFDKFLIDKRNSFMIGDKNTDKKCAKKSKLKFFYAENNFSNQIKKIIRKI